jgi:hypothetical protein
MLSLCFVNPFSNLINMARFTPSAFLSDIRGKVGSIVFQRNGSGHIIRSVGAISNPASNVQRIARSYMAQLYKEWLSLTAAQQSDWTAFAVFANLKMKHNGSLYLTGYSTFIQINFIRLCYSLAILSDPFNSSDVPTVFTGTLEIGSSGLQLTGSRSFVPANEFVICSLTPPISSGCTYSTKRLRLFPCTTEASDHVHLNTLYGNIYGITPAAGMIIGCKYSSVSLLSGLQLAFNYSTFTL